MANLSMSREDAPGAVKPGNQSRVLWHGAQGERTPLGILYLHGFTASAAEPGLLVDELASRLGCNAYFPLWPGHGSDHPMAMKGLTAETLKTAARDAMTTMMSMCERVIIIGSSLGGTLGLWLASEDEFGRVAAVAALSPGVQAADPSLLGQLCSADEPLVDPRPRSGPVQAFWSTVVHPDGYRALRDLFQMFSDTPPWPAVECPVFLGYYQAPDGQQDQTASVPAMLGMFAALGAPDRLKVAMSFDAQAHVIGSPYKTAMAAKVMARVEDFLHLAVAT